MQNFIRTGTFLLFLTLLGCKDSSTITASSNLVGSMAGFIYPFDTIHYALNTLDIDPTLQDNSGIRVSLDGTNYTTTTDKSGRWELDNIPAGTYDIAYSKDGFATYKTIAYRFIGNGADYLGKNHLYQIAKRNVNLTLGQFNDFTDYNAFRDSLYLDSTGKQHSISVHDTIFYPNELASLNYKVFRDDSLENLPGLNSIIFLFGKSENMSPLDPKSYIFEYDTRVGMPFNVSRTNLLNKGFSSKEKVYYMAYASNLYEVTLPAIQFSSLYVFYTDIVTGKNIITSFGDNHSEVKSFILP